MEKAGFLSRSEPFQIIKGCGLLLEDQKSNGAFE
jgi:hypothetical protein